MICENHAHIRVEWESPEVDCPLCGAYAVEQGLLKSLLTQQILYAEMNNLVINLIASEDSLPWEDALQELMDVHHRRMTQGEQPDETSLAQQGEARAVLRTDPPDRSTES